MQIGNTQTKKKGFTLIELLVVIAIIGLLSTIGFGLLRGTFLGKGRDAQRMSHIREIGLAMEAGYNAATNEYPEILATQIASGRLNSGVSAGGVTLPRDPGGGTNTSCSTDAEMTAGGYCAITNTGTKSQYCVYANLAGGEWFVASRSGVRQVTSAPATLAACNP